MKRVLCLYIPFLSTDRLQRQDSDTTPDPSALPCKTGDRVPAATIAPYGQTIRIVHVNQAAGDSRIRPGRTLAEAKAVIPDLVTHDDDPEADRRRLESLAVWADCLSPIVHLEGEDTLLADVTGCERLFNGELNLLRRAIEGLRGQGFSVRGAIADTPGAAWAVAHAHPEPAVVVPPGQSAAYLAPLPVWSLKIDDKTTAALASVGVKTIESLLYLPRSSLAFRFGDAVLDRIDQVLGDMPEVLTPYRPRPALTSRVHFGAATTRLDLLQKAIRRALEGFCQKLERRVAGVRQMFVTFYCPDMITEEGSQMRTVTLGVDLSRPTRSADHLRCLLTALLDQVRLPAPADSLMLWTHRIDPLDDWQDELFTTDSRDAQELGDLLDRLAVRLGPDAAVRPQLLSEHQPERAFRYVSLVGLNGAPNKQAAGNPQRAAGDPQRAAGFNPRGSALPSRASQGSTDPRRLKPAAHTTEHDIATPDPRPLRLLPQPIHIAATSLVPEGPPISFRLHGTPHTVIDSVGPERIETGWWRGPHMKRDYYRVATETGRRLWLFFDRDTGQWFLHGWFD
jgi:protein ImuB